MAAGIGVGVIAGGTGAIAFAGSSHCGFLSSAVPVIVGTALLFYSPCHSDQAAAMTVRKIEIERLDVTSGKPVEAVINALQAAIGHPDMVEFQKANARARSFAELESAVNRGLGKTGLMLFMRFDAGAVLRLESGRATPKIMRFLIGNPLIMKDMAKHVPDAAAYAPVTVLVDERPDGVHLS